jgi:hypothetical protein
MKINETRRRSILKAISFRIIEVVVDSLILLLFVSPTKAIGLGVLFESICLGLDYLKERVWNKTDYGREVK